MLFCKRPNLETWSPNFSSSGLLNPTWTRVRCDGAELCNSLEFAEWRNNPVQVQICDACGTVGCASGGYIHLSAIDDVVFWTMPQLDKVDDETEARFFCATALMRFGAVAFPPDSWALIREAGSDVPDPRTLPYANGRVLLDAWVVGRGHPKAVDQLVPWLRAHLLAADSLDASAAIQWVEYWVSWFGQRAKTPLEGAIVETSAAEAEIEKFYFDGPGSEDWPALAKYRNTFVPALGSDHIFAPAG